MPPTAAAFLPHPPLLVPALAGAAAPELDPLRHACRLALEAVIAAAGTTVLIGDGPVWGVPNAAATGSFRPYGADLEVVLPALLDLDLTDLPEPARLADLPLSLAVAAYLLAGLDTPPARLLAATAPASLGPGAAATIGRHLAAAAQRRRATAGTPTLGGDSPVGVGGDGSVGVGGAGPVGVGGDGTVGLVVLGDLSACRTDLAPGGFRPEAAAFDASVAAAFRTGALDRLLDLDPDRAADLMAAGRVPLQVLAGALQSAPAMCGQVLYEDAPYGVGYLVALLTAS
ncbi:MAG TPA: hypothetical protein VGS14_08380 [Actinomycetes bacterium]|nr:hypothetical protein [Actinomycetes bacterium]